MGGPVKLQLPCINSYFLKLFLRNDLDNQDYDNFYF